MDQVLAMILAGDKGVRTGILCHDRPKPEVPEGNMVSMGIYAFNKQIPVERLVEDAAHLDSPHDFGYAIIPMMVNRDRVFAYRFDDYWQDIGSAEAYYEVNMALVRRQLLFYLDSTWPILTEENDLLPPAEFQLGTVHHSFIGRSCVVNGHVENSVLSPGVRVKEQAVVRNSILMANVFVNSHSIVENCVLDEGVSIGEFCYIGVGNTPLPDKGDITVLSKNVTVPDYTAISRNSRIWPSVRYIDFVTNFVPGYYHFADMSALLRDTLVK